MSVLTLTALNQSYGGSHTLWDVDLAVPTGSRTCLMGRNGMGKTTLLKCIMGLLPTASGAMSYGIGAEAVDIAKVADNPSVSAGDQIGFTITVTNNGAGTARNVSVN